MRLTASELIGRRDEFGQLDAAVARLLDGSGSAVGVVGDPGLGKSRLLRETLRRIAPHGIAVAVGRATQGLPAPFRPLAEAVLMLDRAHGVRARPETAELIPVLAGVVPSWASAARVETSMPVIGDALLRLFDSIGDRGILVGLEDLHWADDETLAVVEYLCDNVADRPILLVATMRPFPVAAHGVFAALARRDAASTIDLTPLRRAEIEVLIRDCLDGHVVADVERFVAERCDGNPLLAEELLAGLHSAGALARADTGWTVSSRLTPSVPLTFVDAVRDRFEGLPPGDRTVLAAAAALGRSFDWRIVAAVVELGGDAVLASLRRAEDVQLIEFRDGGHQFRHALTCDAIGGLLSDEERRAIAARALDVVAGDRAECPAVGAVDHAIVASLAEQAGELTHAVRHLRAAASENADRGAMDSAVSVLRHAELLAHSTADRLDVAADLAEVLALTGRADDARDVAERALARDATPEGDRIARLMLVMARAALIVGDWVRADREVAGAVAAGPRDLAVRAGIDSVRAHVQLNVGRPDDAIAHADNAIAVAVAAGRHDIACEALEVLGRHARFLDPVRSSEAFERAVAVADEAGLGGWRLRALHELAINDAFIDWRTDRLRDVRDEAERQGAILTLAVVDLHIAGTLLVAGERDAGREAILRCVAACRRYRLAMLPIALVHLAVAHALGADRVAADAAAAEALALAPDDPDVAAQVAAWVDGTHALMVGDLDTWRHHLDRAMTIVGDDPATIPSPWRGQWALAHAVAGNLAPAARLRSSHAGVVGLNRAQLYLVDAVGHGRRGRADDANAASAQADALMAVEPCGLPRHLGRLLIAPSAVVDGWGTPGGWLREADVWFGEAGLPGLADLTRSTMRDLDVPVPRRGRGDSEVPAELRALGVTSREMDVLHLLVERCPNRTIAERLHLSVRTVEKHVASLLAKTSTDDRRTLALRFAPVAGRTDRRLPV